MTHAEQASLSESRYGRDTRSSASRQDGTSRRGPSRDASSRSEGVDAYTAKRRKKRRGRALRVVLVTLFLALVGIGTAAALYISNIDSRLSEGVSEEVIEQLVTVEAQEPFYMLLLGVDKSEARAETSSSFRADTIILARVDPENLKVTLVSIPRDTLVDMGDYGQNKINAAYTFGGAAYMIEVVSEFAGVEISHYAEIDFEQFTSIVDLIGGIEVTLPVDVVDEEYAGINLTAGTHTLDGETALALVRTRHAYDAYGAGDFYRAANQRMVIAAIIEKVLQLDVTTMATTVSELADSVTTDLSVAEILSLAMQFRDLDIDSDIYSGQTPTISEYINSVWYEVPDEEGWAEMMERVRNGESPYSSADQDFTAGVAGSIGSGTTISDSDDDSSSDSEATATYSGSVLVLNGAGVSGLAASKSTILEEAGFSPYADTASSSNHTTTMIYYNGDAEDVALGVADTLGVSEDNIAENTEGYSTSYDVVVVLGSDQVS